MCAHPLVHVLTESVCGHAHVFMCIHPCICTQLVLLVCVWVQKHVFLSVWLVHASVCEWIHWALAVCLCIMLHINVAHVSTCLGPAGLHLQAATCIC